MDIFRSRLYRLNVTMLSVVGLWPYQKFKSWQIFQQSICQISVFTVLMPQAFKLFEIWGDLDIMIECLTPMAVQFVSIIKATNCIINRKQMVQLLESMKRDWSSLKNKKEVEILTKYTEQGRNLTVLYSVFLFGSAFIYLLIPLLPRFLDVIVPMNESRPPVYLYQSQYYVDPEEYFLWIFLHCYSGTVVEMTMIVAADTMFVCYVMHVCGVLAVIGHRLENLTSREHSDDDVYIMSKDEDERCYREIVLCIDQHYRATEAVKTIESSYSMSYFLVLGIAMILLSLSAIQLLIKFGQIGEMIRLVQFNLAQCNHLLFNSWPCQKLIDQSINFRESLYSSEWYSLSEENKNLLRFSMLRTLNPQKITAGKIYVMSIENFGVVIQSSISYFMVFASIR